MKIRASLMAAAMTALLFASIPTRALAIGSGGTCYQTGLTAGCSYIITYDDGTSVSQTADSQGRVARPCNRIITHVQVGVPGAGCYDTQPIRPGAVV